MSDLSTSSISINYDSLPPGATKNFMANLDAWGKGFSWQKTDGTLHLEETGMTPEGFSILQKVAEKARTFSDFKEMSFVRKGCLFSWAYSFKAVGGELVIRMEEVSSNAPYFNNSFVFNKLRSGTYIVEWVPVPTGRYRGKTAEVFFVKNVLVTRERLPAYFRYIKRAFKLSIASAEKHKEPEKAALLRELEREVREVLMLDLESTKI